MLLGFGGPEKFDDVRPFLSSVLRGRSVPTARIEEVVGQYQQIGGASPYNSLARDLADGLAKVLPGVPVGLGMRHGNPSIIKTLSGFLEDGIADFTAVVLSPYRSIPSWNYYLRSTAQAMHSIGDRLRLKFVAPYHAHPLLESAIAGRISDVLHSLPPKDQANVMWLFCAHSIPTEWDVTSGYSRQIESLCARLFARLTRRVNSLGAKAESPGGQPTWRLVFQSRSGKPEELWLEPDISAFLASSPEVRGRPVMVIPVGFLMDHVEVLFDLDIKARAVAVRVGAEYHRVKTVGIHSQFIQMLAQIILEKMK